MSIDEKLVAADMVAFRLQEAISLLSVESRNTTAVSDMVIKDGMKALEKWRELNDQPR